jgi:hypothetical protein
MGITHYGDNPQKEDEKIPVLKKSGQRFTVPKEIP